MSHQQQTDQRACVVRQQDGTYRVWVEGAVGVLLASSLADAMHLAYQLSPVFPQ